MSANSKFFETFSYRAERKFEDDIPDEVKSKRLSEIIDKQLKFSLASNQKRIGLVEKVLIEGESKRSKEHMCGRTSRNSMVVFPKGNGRKGQYVNVKITDCTSATLIGREIN